MPRALVAVSEGSEELETVGIVDILRRGKVNVTLASEKKKKTVKCSKGTIIVDIYYRFDFYRLRMLCLKM